jgi:nicotinamide mononucleotide adenylyltransferase
MFEMAKDYVRQNPSCNFEIVGAYLSPVSDQYKKPGLLSADHRINMCQLATGQASSWLMVDSWEPTQPEYQRTAVVLNHFEHEINVVLGGARTSEGDMKSVRIMLLAGSDLLSTMADPGVWSASDLDHILGRYGAFIVERTGADLERAMDALQKWSNNIFVVSQMIQNDVSSTKIRLFLRRGMSVRYLLPSDVIDYIEEHGLYLDEGTSGNSKWTYKATSAA